MTLTNLEEGVGVTAYIKELTPAGFSVDIDFEGVTSGRIHAKHFSWNQ
jgi:ribosomal protein S1